MKKKLTFLLSFLEDSDILNEIKNRYYYDMFLKDLKNYLPYSRIFTKKVSKKEAPTYYEVIENPMDLGKMTKKIIFYDKESFFKDLDLIWDNCLRFNSDSPFFINYAKKMSKKSESLKAFYFENEFISWKQFEELNGIHPSDLKISTLEGYTRRLSMSSNKEFPISPKRKAAKNYENLYQSYIFIRKLIKVASAKIFINIGFCYCSRNALEIFCDVFIFFLEKIILNHFSVYSKK